MNRFLGTLVILWCALLCHAVAAQDTAEMPSVLTRLNIFDEFGINASVNNLSAGESDIDLDQIQWGLLPLIEDPKRRALQDVFGALGFIGNTVDSRNYRTFCELMGEITDEVYRYRPSMAIIKAAAGLGIVAPQVEPSERLDVGRWNLNGDGWIERFRSLRTIADHSDTPDDLAQSALSMIHFEWTLNQDAAVLDAVVSYCSKPSATFQFNAYSDPTNFRSAYMAAWPELGEPEICSRPNNIENYRLAFPQFDGNLFPLLRETGVNAFKIICANAEIVLPFAELDTVELDGVLIESLDLSGARLGRLAITNSRAANAFNLADATFSGRITISGLITDGPANLHRIRTQGDVRIDDSSFGAPAAEGENPAERLSFYGADIARQLMLGNVVVNGDLTMGTARVDHLRLEGVHVDGMLNLWGSTINGPAFIGHGSRGIFVKGALEAWYMRASDMQINNAYVEGDIVLNNASIAGATYGSNVYAGGQMQFRGFRGGEFTLSVARAERINLRSANFSGSMALSGVATGFLDGFELGAGYLGINSWPADRDSEGTALNLSTCLPPFEMPEETQILYGMSLAIYDALGLGQLACLERLSLVGANIAGNLDLGGAVLTSTDLSSARIDGQLSLAGDDASYSPHACVVARGMRVDTIVYDLTGALGRPALTDFYGAEYRIMRGSAPGQAFGRDWDSARLAIRQFLGGTDRHCDLALGVQRDEERPRATYQPAVYDALAEGFERTGDLDIARRIRIIKNQDYAAALEPTGDGFFERAGFVATRLVYWFADIVSGYGYDNLKAVIWLIGITAFGFFLTAINDLLQSGFFHRVAVFFKSVFYLLGTGVGRLVAWIRRKDYVARVRGDSAKPVEASPATPRPFSFWDALRRTLTGLAFSVDRSIPALELDQDFGRHAYFGLKGVLSGWFYLQRFLSFLIVVLMIAGAFNVFQ